MSSWHRHNPEFSDTIDLMFGVHVARPNEAVVDGPDEDELIIAPCGDCGRDLEWSPMDGPPFRCSPCNTSLAEAFIAVSRLAFEPAPDAIALINFQTQPEDGR